MTFAGLPSTDVVSAELFPLEKDIRVLFYELGVVALNNWLGVHALQLYTDLQIAEPEAPYPILGMGLVAMAVGDTCAAKQNFTHPIVQESPLAPYAQGYLAMSYKLSGNNGGFEEASLAAKEGSNGELQFVLDEVGKTHIDISQP
ncbi:MAG: hypothetical protein ACKOLA_14925 [Spartobacteria bacterium]